MPIKINGQDLSKRYINGSEVIKVMKSGVQVRPAVVPPAFDDYLCFSATNSGTQMRLRKSDNPPNVQLETSYDKVNRSDYTIDTYVSVPSNGGKIYRRNKSEQSTNFSTSSGYYFFDDNDYISADGDVTSLLCKSGTNTLYPNCFRSLFSGSLIITAPKLPATTLASGCYKYMFYGSSITVAPQLPATTLAGTCYQFMFAYCPNLTTGPHLPATTLESGCYEGMFYKSPLLETVNELPATTLPDGCYNAMYLGCSSIKISQTPDSEYVTAYTIPSSGTGTAGWHSLDMMFTTTGGTFKGTPSINTTYYTSNTVI